jgi:outer membrane receptor protein involved in Fe transport
MRIRACSSIVLATWILFSVDACSSAEQPDPSGNKDVFEMSIEELMTVEVTSTATLTGTAPRLVPAAVTTITQEQIKASGARSLYELLDIYVPNLQWSRHHWENDVMGLRGIINDRDDKYLLLVNGRNMNQRTHYGALSEQDLVLLSDIHHVDVVRGPGSALYGPGAISMVINIVTYNANTFQGTEVTGRTGAIEEFYAGEIKHGQRFDSNDGGIFVYAGMGDYLGASKYNAPQVYPFTFPSTGGGAPDGVVPGDGTLAGDPMTNGPLNRDGADAPHVNPTKLHVEVTKGNLDVWARYTMGGKEFGWQTGSIARGPYGWGDWAWWSKYGGNLPYRRPNFYAYQQLTGFAGYTLEMAENLNVDFAVSCETISTVKEREIRPSDDYREDNLYAKALLKWQPSDNHKIAFGPEYYHFNLGLDSWDGFDYSQRATCGTTPIYYPHSQAWAYNNPMPRWSTDMYSLLGEWQWNINNQWTTFLGARLDKHTFTETMFSPRAAAVYTPTTRDTLKLMWTESVRTNFEEEMKITHDNTGDKSDPEELESYEIRYERQQTKHLDLAASVYYHNLDVISWNSRNINVGTQEDWGLEGEISYHTEKTRLTFSHGWTKLIDFDLKSGQDTYISGEPYGYGDDLTNWSNHISKLVYQRKLDAQWTFDASMRVYWGFPGLKDYDEFHPGVNSPDNSVTEPGWERAYRGSYFLDLGLQYRPSKHLEVALTGYNLLGIVDRDLNKRNYIETGGGGSDFRSQAPALGLSLTYTF